MYFQQLNFSPHFLCVFGQRWRFLQTFSMFGPTNTSKITYLTESTLPNNERTWNMVHFWCTSNNWTFCIISLVFLTVMKVSMEIFSFGGKNVTKTQIWQIYPPQQQNILWVGSSLIYFPWLSFMPSFQAVLKKIKVIIGISAFCHREGNFRLEHIPGY